ncbi:MAG TPA: LCP family protein [Bacillota bacterium]|mgnify:CR=1 FL=1|nr:LCP family protein [Bacillota bacterium]HQC36093.1 LCP family protein [Bacillota bacterium]
MRDEFEKTEGTALDLLETCKPDCSEDDDALTCCESPSDEEYTENGNCAEGSGSSEAQAEVFESESAKPEIPGAECAQSEDRDADDVRPEEDRAESAQPEEAGSEALEVAAQLAEREPVKADRALRNGSKRRSAVKSAGNGKNRKSRVILLTLLAVAFLVGIFIFGLKSKTDVVTGKKVTIAEYVVGELAGKTFMGKVEERLSRDMTPIVIDESSPLYEKFKNSDRVNILLLGVNANMTDTIMLGSYDMTAQQVDIISIPRDTYYYRKGYGADTAFQKINSMWRTDGSVALATAVSELLEGMPIHYYVVVEYEDIQAVMEVIGGVEFDVPFHMKYIDNTPGYELKIDIPAGKQIIDSSNVMQFLRFRQTNPFYAKQGYQGYPGGDVQRTQVHQEFMKLVIKKCCKIGNILEVAQVVLDNVDSDLTYGMAFKIAAKVIAGFDPANIQSYILPGKDFTNTLSFWGKDEEGTLALVEKLYGVEYEDPQQPEYIEPGSRIRFVGVPQLTDEVRSETE